MKSKFLVILLSFLSSLFIAAGIKAKTMAECSLNPVSIAGSVAPGVVFLVDYSGSMNYVTYIACGSSNCADYNSATAYYGYFDTESYYQYSSNRFVAASCGAYTNRAAGSSSCLSGNLLNWITTTRIDATRKVLTGGRITSGTTNRIESEGSSDSYTDNKLKCKFTLSTGSKPYDRMLTIANSASNTVCPLGNNIVKNYNIKLDVNGTPTGLVQKMYPRMELSLLVFSGGRYAEGRAKKSDPMSTFVNAINNESPGNSTPTGESLWEVYDFFKQQDLHNYETNTAYISKGNGKIDPFYDSSNKVMTCRKCFTILFSDGQWNASIDPVKPAYALGTEDLRSDIPGVQSASIYTIYAFGDGIAGSNALKTSSLFGDFDDMDGNKWPYPFTTYPSDSRKVTYPLSKCNPAGTLDKLCQEWDPATPGPGQVGLDGNPDNYFEVTDGATLEQVMSQVFLGIVAQVSSGTAASAVSTASSGVGAIYQAYFEPKRDDSKGNSVSWIGNVQAFFLDSYGNMREDGDQDGKLDGYHTDPVIEFYYDSASGQTKVKRWSSKSDTTYTPSSATSVVYGNLKPLWNAIDQLVFPSNPDLTKNRAYDALASQGRFIKTWIDNNPKNGRVDAGEYLDFEYVSSPATAQAELSAVHKNSWQYLNTASEAEAGNVVNYVRGVEISGTRTRVLDYNEDGKTEVIRLGDIVNSSPTVVTAPQEALDLLYDDESYKTFYQMYKNRRQVVYAGGNDGLLHAFNGGFYDPETQAFSVSGKKRDGGAASKHPLGSELWAYAPYNLLASLQWLKDTSYTHVFYVDRKPRVIDARIFPADDDHPEGWGTVLVVGMRLGGCPQDIIGNTVHLRSAYVLFDVTNPELEPKLLAEIPLPDESYALMEPAVLPFGTRGNSSETQVNQWFLVLGSGPTDLTTVTASSTTNPQLEIFDLCEIGGGCNIATKLASCDGRTVPYRTACYQVKASATSPDPAKGTFLGDPAVADWTLDYKPDTVYFGLVGSETGNQGKLMRFSLANEFNPSKWLAPTVLLDTNQPVSVHPKIAVDEYLNWWVFAGTGRFLSQGDKTSTTKQSLYGIVDANDGKTVIRSTLADVTNAKVLTDGTLSGVQGSTANVSQVTKFSELEQKVGNSSSGLKGWLLDLKTSSGPAERNIEQSALTESTLISPAYTPGSDTCSAAGTSELYVSYYKTGTAKPDPIIGTTSTGSKESARTIDLGTGITAAPTIHSGADAGGNIITIFTQTSAGIINKSQASVRPRSTGEISWDESPTTQ